MNSQKDKKAEILNNNILEHSVKNLEITKNDNISDKIDVWTFIRTVDKPSSSLKSCICGEHCDNNINENVQINEKDLTELEYCKNIKSNSTPTLFSWMNRRLSKPLVINDASTSSSIINENDLKASAENSDYSNDECLANTSKKKNFSSSSNASSVGSSCSNSSTKIASHKWKPLLKMKAFQNERQDTFHSLDMYSKQKKNSLIFSEKASDLTDVISELEKTQIARGRAAKYSAPSEYDLTKQVFEQTTNISKLE